MDPETIAPMVVFVTLILTTGGVVLLRPITRSLAQYLNTLTEQRKALGANPDVAQMREMLANVESRLSLLEERQAFTEALLMQRREAPALPAHEQPAPDPER